MNARVYIDGFNLYYRAVKDTPYKWLNLRVMCELLLPEYSIGKIKYFTARVSARKADPGKPARQQIYFRALRTIPNFEIMYGRFLSRDKFMPLSNPIFGNGVLSKWLRRTLHDLGYKNTFLDKHKIVRVINTEEKGSDVNLASQLLIDGFTNQYDVAVVVSNDSDLAEPIRYVRDELGFTVVILNPDEKITSKKLTQVASSIRKIRKGVLASSQFPDELRDSKGAFHKPGIW